MIGYAKRYGLTLEDYEKQPGETFYHFDGELWPEAVVVDEYRAFVSAMRDDLRRLSRKPQRTCIQADDIVLDNLSLAEYLATRGAGRIARQAIEVRMWSQTGHELFFVAFDGTVMRTAIAQLQYGDNAKMMVGFTSPYWRTLESSGALYSDLANHQATWETNPTARDSWRARASPASARRTNYWWT